MEITMVDVKQAVHSATAFVGELYPEARDIRLEEVDLASSEWKVVVSFKIAEPTTLSYVIGTEQRLFKTVSIDSQHGEATSLKVWKQ